MFQKHWIFLGLEKIKMKQRTTQFEGISPLKGLTPLLHTRIRQGMQWRGHREAEHRELDLKYSAFSLWGWFLGTKKVFYLVFPRSTDEDETFQCISGGHVLVLSAGDKKRHKIFLLWLFSLYFNSNLLSTGVVQKINGIEGEKWMCKVKYSTAHTYTV